MDGWMDRWTDLCESIIIRGKEVSEFMTVCYFKYVKQYLVNEILLVIISLMDSPQLVCGLLK